MAEPLNRGEIVALLERLGDDDDDEVLAAARALHTTVTDAGIGWDELLTDEGAAKSVGPETVAEQTAAAHAPGDDQAALALIEKLLARSGITDDFRREMEGYKSDITEGTFADDDRRYLAALDKRLSGKG